MRHRWTGWQINERRYVLELDERLTPPGLAIELEVLSDARSTTCTWRLEGGAVLARVRPGDA